MTAGPPYRLCTSFVLGAPTAAKPRPRPTRPLPATDQDIALAFESLGDNCEFGIFQRYVGVEPLGLLRFNFTPLDTLIHGLENGFADLAEPGQVEAIFDAAMGEWMISETVYKFSYHTYNRDSALPAVDVRDSQARWMKYMAARLLEGLALGDRIFVRKGEPVHQEPEIRRLHQALRRHGDVTLLWVCVPDRGQKPGTVEWLAPGLMRGWIDTLAPYTDVLSMYAAPWRAVCRAALGLWLLDDQTALPVRDLSAPGALSFAGWSGTDAATSQLSWDVSPPAPGLGVMRHRLIADSQDGVPVFGCVIDKGVEPGALYTASARVWVPENFSGTRVWMEMRGRPRAASVTAALSARHCWQVVSVGAFLALDGMAAFPQLHVSGPAGTIVYSSDWRLDVGPVALAVDR